MFRIKFCGGFIYNVYRFQVYWLVNVWKFYEWYFYDLEIVLLKLQ